MWQMEQDLGTGRDWNVVALHSTSYPHTHIILRGVTENQLYHL
jgi:hypothetical protein